MSGLDVNICIQMRRQRRTEVTVDGMILVNDGLATETLNAGATEALQTSHVRKLAILVRHGLNHDMASLSFPTAGLRTTLIRNHHSHAKTLWGSTN